MPHSRRDFLKGAAAGTNLAWENLRLAAAPANASREAAATVESPRLETRVPIPLAQAAGRRTSLGDLAVPGGESIHVTVERPEGSRQVAWRLRLIGEVDVDRHLRVEGEFISLYRLIDDALDTRTTHHRTYSLALRSAGESYPRRAYFRVFANSPAEERHRLKVWVKTDDLEILPGGRVGMEAAVYRKRPNRNPGDMTGPPDRRYFVSATEGTADWQELQLPIPVTGDVACVLFTVAGENFRGRIWLEDPQFIGPGSFNSLADFSPARPYTPYRNWIGENLSQKEWPRFRLAFNGTEFFHGKLFQPEYAWPAAEVDVPPGLLRAGANDLTIEHVSDYHQPLAFNLRGLEWLQSPGGRIEVLASPQLVDAGKEFSILIETREADLALQVHVEPAPGHQRAGFAPLQSSLPAPAAGLHFVKFRAGQAGPGGTATLRCGEDQRRVTVERVVARPEDGVLVGGGDCFYVAAEPASYRRFHIWYLHHSLGNSIVYRHIYHFGGTQALDPMVWKDAVSFCEAAGLKYSFIVSGSEMPGMDAGPTDDLLAGASFRGPQLHEHDGLYNYWGVASRWPDEELFQALLERFPARERCGRIGDPRLWGGGAMEPVYYDPHRARDMREGSEYFGENIRRGLLTLADRHSGPSTLFKYFFQAGYKWLAAETLYGPHEIVLAALRGASLAYGQPHYGAHVAAQWSTSPHDDPAAFRRYFLALATPYIHGTEHIYIEDGLWHMEQGRTANDRFSPACQGHLKVHQDFYHFTRAHSRRGRMRVPVGFVHGQHDGWTCWSRARVWGQLGAEWDFAEPEKSWDLLTVFFPRSVLAPVYNNHCPHAPQGFFTGTPYGPADIVPIEADLKTLSKYSTLVFLGWNTAGADQVERLREYVEAGGRLVLALPHVSTEVRRNHLPQPLDGPALRQLLGMQIRGFMPNSGNWLHRNAAGKSPVTVPQGGNLQLGKVSLEGAVPRLVDEAGTPVVLERQLGKGKVTFVNVAAYPGDSALEDLYRELLRETGRRVLAEQSAKVWVQGTEDVSFAVYDWEPVPGESPVRSVYLLNVNWWSDETTLPIAHLLWRGADVPLALARGRIHIVTLTADWGIWTQDNRTDVAGLKPHDRGAEVSLQGQGRTTLCVLYHPAALGSARIKLRGRSSQGPLVLKALNVPGLWETEITLCGPEQINLSVER